MKRRELKFVHGSPRLVPEEIGAASPAIRLAAAARKGRRPPRPKQAAGPRSARSPGSR